HCLWLRSDSHGQGKNLVHLLPHLLTPAWLQVPHGTFHVRVSKPLLHCPEVNSGPQARGRERARNLCSQKFSGEARCLAKRKEPTTEDQHQGQDQRKAWTSTDHKN